MTKNYKLQIIFFLFSSHFLTYCSNQQNEKTPADPVTNKVQETAIEQTGRPNLTEIELNQLFSHTEGDSPSPYFDNLVIESSKQEFSATQAFQLAQLYEDGNNGNTIPNLTLADHWFSYAIKNDTSADKLYCTRLKQIMEADERAMNDKAQQKLDLEKNGRSETELKNLNDWHQSNLNRYSKIIADNCN